MRYYTKFTHHNMHLSEAARHMGTNLEAERAEGGHLLLTERLHAASAATYCYFSFRIELRSQFY